MNVVISVCFVHSVRNYHKMAVMCVHMESFAAVTPSILSPFSVKMDAFFHLEWKQEIMIDM